MNQYNNTGTNPLYLNYDLSTNYLCGVQVKSLRESCKLKAVVNSFECDEAVQEMRRMFIDKGQKDTSNLFTIVKKDLANRNCHVVLKKKWSCYSTDMILTYFNNLIPHNIDLYFNGYLDASKLHTFLIFYWRIKFSTEYFQNDVSYQEIGFDILLIHN
ncbi:Protoporphyrinogen oxidase [Armadillidium vulgare]|nr:Protoporphyrinogen oxidase [Armadillidium vulgare]